MENRPKTFFRKCVGRASSFPVRVYACSGIFIAHLHGNEPHSPASTDILDAGRDGSIELHTSFLTVTEVIASERSVLRRTRADEAFITSLMDREFISYSAVDLIIAELSRIVSWDFQIRAQDAIHVATAIVRKCDVLYTTDRPLVTKSGQKTERATLPEIRLPEMIVRQPQLPL